MGLVDLVLKYLSKDEWRPCHQHGLPLAAPDDAVVN